MSVCSLLDSIPSSTEIVALRACRLFVGTQAMPGLGYGDRLDAGKGNRIDREERFEAAGVVMAVSFRPRICGKS